MAFLQFIGCLIFVFFLCYLISAMGNSDYRDSHKANRTLGCALMMFVPAVLYILLLALFGK